MAGGRLAGGRLAGEQPPACPGLLAIQRRTPGKFTEVGGCGDYLLTGLSAHGGDQGRSRSGGQGRSALQRCLEGLCQRRPAVVAL